ncbi:hypothetical protein SUGI_0765280 [Cryptomeria japonica]|nr:hypothetical protein SUGI_0765280 [Cryptomeria japonica]
MSGNSCGYGSGDRVSEIEEDAEDTNESGGGDSVAEVVVVVAVEAGVVVGGDWRALAPSSQTLLAGFVFPFCWYELGCGSLTGDWDLFPVVTKVEVDLAVLGFFFGGLRFPSLFFSWVDFLVVDGCGCAFDALEQFRLVSRSSLLVVFCFLLLVPVAFSGGLFDNFFWRALASFLSGCWLCLPSQGFNIAWSIEVTPSSIKVEMCFVGFPLTGCRGLFRMVFFILEKVPSSLGALGAIEGSSISSCPLLSGIW